MSEAVPKAIRPDLSERVVWISGAGRGLGRSAAVHLARCGAIVGVSDIDAAACAETAQVIREAGGLAHALPADVSDRDQVFEATATLAERTGRIDAVLNNASLLVYEKLEDVRPETVNKMIGVGIEGALWGSQALLKHYHRDRGGVIVNFASPVAFRGSPTTSVYSSIKGALVSLTRVLAAELGPAGVRVNAVAPGSVPTPGALKYVNQAEYERRARTIPLRRLGQESDVDHALAFLLSDEATFINGTILHIDGGIVAAA
ncbi:MAG: SDR family oxidoreductase [Gammaproteobacteria bacterium]